MADNLTTPIPDTTVIGTKDVGSVHFPKKILVDFAGAEVLGQVTASPTANTVLDRLKALLTGIVLAAGTNAIGKLSANSGVDIGDVDVTSLPYSQYETVAASQTAQVLGGTGATGDYLSHILVTPATTSPGVVTILDNVTSINVFAGGASSVSNLVPFTIHVGAKSVSGAWKVTTGANVSVVAIGAFSA